MPQRGPDRERERAAAGEELACGAVGEQGLEGHAWARGAEPPRMLLPRLKTDACHG